MTEVNSMYRAETRSDGLKAQIEKLEGLAHHTAVNPTFDQFDAETEDILMKIYGANHKHVESYKYATVGQAEALVNLPESAQEPQTRDIPKKRAAATPAGVAEHSDRSAGTRSARNRIAHRRRSRRSPRSQLV